MQAGKPIKEVWEEEFKVADRQKQIQEQEIQQRIDAEVNARMTKFMSEHNLPVQPSQTAGSPILAEFKPPAQDRSQMSGVDAAVAAFNEKMAASQSAATGA
jgi:hypothetical protein